MIVQDISNAFAGSPLKEFTIQEKTVRLSGSTVAIFHAFESKRDQSYPLTNRATDLVKSVNQMNVEEGKRFKIIIALCELGLLAVAVGCIVGSVFAAMAIANPFVAGIVVGFINVPTIISLCLALAFLAETAKRRAKNRADVDSNFSKFGQLLTQLQEPLEKSIGTANRKFSCGMGEDPNDTNSGIPDEVKKRATRQLEVYKIALEEITLLAEHYKSIQPLPQSQIES